MSRVLIIDDDAAIRRLLTVSLSVRGYEVSEASDAFSGLQELRSFHPDLVLLDLGLPDMDGKDLLASLRTDSAVPVVVLSVRDTESDIVGLLQSGADDYLTKPFNTNELLARVEAVLRRRTPAADQKLAAGAIVVDTRTREVRVRDIPVKLTPTEYEILRILVSNADRIVTRSGLTRELWGDDSESGSGSLRVHIVALRKKIELDPAKPELIVNEPGVGYRLCSGGLPPR